MKTLHLLIVVTVLGVMTSMVLIPAFAESWQSYVVSVGSSGNPALPAHNSTILYHIMDGTGIFQVHNYEFTANVSSRINGTFEISIPRDLPYFNGKDGPGNAETYVVIENGVQLTSDKYTKNISNCFFTYSIPFRINSTIVVLSSDALYLMTPIYGDRVSDSCMSGKAFADGNSAPHLSVTTDYGGNGIMVNSNQNMSAVLPSPPLGMYPYTSKIFSVFQIDPEIVRPTDTSSIHILVTNNANFTLYDVTLGESVNDSKSLLFSNIHKIDILNPNQTKTIYGTLYVSDSVRPTDYYDIWWNIVAKNQTGNMMESMQFHRNLPIAQNLPHYYSGPVVITLESPLKQFKSGITTQNIVCNDGFMITIKKQGHQPACVDPDTASKLVFRGWSENPLDGLLLKYGNQTQANLVFYDIMNEPKIRDWSMKGWRYSDYSYASNGETGQSSATIHLYLPSNIGQHKCENGSYGSVVVNLKPIEIEHNYTEVGCEIVTTTVTSVDPESNGR